MLPVGLYYTALIILTLLIMGAIFWMFYEYSLSRNRSPFCLRQHCSDATPPNIEPREDPEATIFYQINSCIDNAPTTEFLQRLRNCASGGSEREFFHSNLESYEGEGEVTRIEYYEQFLDAFLEPSRCGFNYPTNGSSDQAKGIEQIRKLVTDCANA